MKRKKNIYYALLLGMLLLAAYYIVQKTNDSFSRPSPISHMRAFQFTDQYGRLITDDTVYGKVILSAFFFTSCQNICPLMNQTLSEFYTAYKDNADFTILSHTCDPERDSVSRLLEYAKDWGVQDSSWLFLTGKAKDLYYAARFIYKIDDRNQSIDSSYQFMHTQLWSLVNKQGEVVCIIDALKPKEVERAKTLIDELLL